MSIKSQALYHYLLESGALGSGDQKKNKAAKREYRLRYQRLWRQKQRETHDEIRILIPNTQVEQLNRAVQQSGLSKVDYLKQLVLLSISESPSEKNHPLLREAYAQLGLLINDLTLYEKAPPDTLKKLLRIERLLEHIIFR